jgi:polar amino acid transport system ATP-binding protein
VTTATQSASIGAAGVHLSLGGNHILRGVDLEVPAGTTTCVIGPSGSGKSTLLRALNRLLEIDSGVVLINGASVLASDPDLLRQQVGMVFQHFNLFPHKTVLQNLTLGLRKLRQLDAEAADELAYQQLDIVGLRDKAKVRPSALSGGQQQRVATARALAMSPQVMLFDEATSALDPELVKGVLSTMSDLSASGMTMVVVTHEMGFARNVADQVAFMDHGIVVEHGKPTELFDTPKSQRLQRFLSQIL